MRLAIWAPALIAPLLAAACAAQNSQTDRQVQELERRVKQLSAKSDRMEDRLAALELAYRAATDNTERAASATPIRPELPTVKVNPNESTPEVGHELDRARDPTADDAKRLTIVGEGSRIETRVGGDSTGPSPANSANKGNSHAPKRSPGNAPATSNSGAQ